MSKKHTTVAIAYDFDGTLAKGNIQENSFIPDLGMNKKDFWAEVQKMSKKHEMDQILAYMYLLITKAKEKGKSFNKRSLIAHGKDVTYFRGVETYFNIINQYAKSKSINLEHFIISSGTKEMIEGTTIKRNFKFIYASSFLFDQHDVPIWPALAINYTTKTQFLFRINKGILNSWDNSKINEYTPEEDRTIPFENMIYIGDGLTDVPAMKLVKDRGGISIGVYTPHSHKKKEVTKLLKENRVNYVVTADYSEESDLVAVIKSLIDRIAAKSSVSKHAKMSGTETNSVKEEASESKPTNQKANS